MGTEVVIKVRERSKAKVENHPKLSHFQKLETIPKSGPNFNSKMDLNPKNLDQNSKMDLNKKKGP